VSKKKGTGSWREPAPETENAVSEHLNNNQPANAQAATLADLAVRINAEHSEVVRALRLGLSHAIAAGNALLEAKALLKHGQWLPWLNDNCLISERTASLYMRLARHAPDLKSATVADLTIREAVTLINDAAEPDSAAPSIPRSVTAKPIVRPLPSSIRILQGDCRHVLKTLADESVHCVVTSPPYWGLRDYGTATWEGGNAECDHQTARSRAKDTVGSKQATSAGSRPNTQWQCACGARRIDNQIGLEITPDAYVAEMVTVFREVRRVLRKDGTLWLNMGDCYAASQYGSGGTNNPYADKLKIKGVENYKAFNPIKLNHGLKSKDLVGMPWRLAFALQADAWYLRQDIIWSKPNPMPESVTDRCTKAHEYLFLLAKSERYYFDQDSIRERSGNEATWNQYALADGHKAPSGNLTQGVNAGFGSKNDSFTHPLGANKRSVWEIATAPFSEAHFATFPPALIEPCILAGCPQDGTVLDPFGGAGTTGLVADRLGRSAILIELNQAYADMARRRIQSDAPLFSAVIPEAAE
jgi:DNA modification methylase